VSRSPFVRLTSSCHGPVTGATPFATTSALVSYGTSFFGMTVPTGSGFGAAVSRPESSFSPPARTAMVTTSATATRAAASERPSVVAISR
jgi:hypothetical protein